MEHNFIKIDGKDLEGYVIPLNGVNLVFVKTEKGMIGCGAFNVNALDTFGQIAATVKTSDGSAISTIHDLLDANINDVNATAKAHKISEGMPAVDAIKYL